jgi:glycosyltransferase involved in cell wall biosynthesis
VSENWIKKTYEIDKLIVPSEFSKWVFENTSYTVQDKEGRQFEAKCNCPIDVVSYPVKTLERDENFELDLEYDVNYLIVAQWAIRKNLEKTIMWFLEEMGDKEVGLVIKSNLAKNCIMDRIAIKSKLTNALREKNRKCKVYLLHGSLSQEEMNSLYTHPKIQALISTTHGEGFGLPLFEASYNALPVLAPGWSGHMDFLHAPVKNKKTQKTKTKALFSKVDYILAPVQKEAVWKDIIVADSMWCYPNKVDFKRKLNSLHKNPRMYKSWAKKLQDHIVENYKEEVILEKMLKSLIPSIGQKSEYVFVSDMFESQYAGGAEMSLQALIDTCPSSVGMVNSSSLSKAFLENNKDSKFIFGNISQLSQEVVGSMADLGVDYSFVEFDYKFCKHRNPLLYNLVEGEECDYPSTRLGQMMQDFMNGASSVFFMSDEQMKIHKANLNGLKGDNLYVLSSLFGKSFFEKIESVRGKKKDNRWVVLGSQSWVKGAKESEEWCKENDLPCDVIWNISPGEFLDKLASSKGICFKPGGLDTCPRFVIEAKLLDCELELNENVQHSNEEWFTGPREQTIEYLKSRPGFFWETAF